MNRALAMLAVSAAFAASAVPATAGGSNDQPAPAKVIVYNGHAGLGSNGSASSFTRAARLRQGLLTSSSRSTLGGARGG